MKNFATFLYSVTFFPHRHFEFWNKISIVPAARINLCKIFRTKVTPAAEIFVYHGISREEVVLKRRGMKKSSLPSNKSSCKEAIFTSGKNNYLSYAKRKRISIWSSIKTHSTTDRTYNLYIDEKYAQFLLFEIPNEGRFFPKQRPNSKQQIFPP